LILKYQYSLQTYFPTTNSTEPEDSITYLHHFINMLLSSFHDIAYILQNVAAVLGKLK